MRLLALDLSLTATGWVRVTPDPTLATILHGTITPPTHRRVGEGDWDWNGRRLDTFEAELLGLLGSAPVDVLVTETTEQGFSFGRRGVGREYRAGLGLGRSMGWLDAALRSARALGVCPPEIVSLSSRLIKQRVTGNRMARKGAVRGFLGAQIGLDLSRWPEAEVDALAVAYVYLEGQRRGPF